MNIQLEMFAGHASYVSALAAPSRVSMRTGSLNRE